MMEEWRTIPDFPDYEASSLGRVRRAGVNYILTPANHSEGYLQVTLMRNGKRSTVRVHQVICRTFHGPEPFPKAMALHKNHKKTDCREDNLYWGSQRQNIDDNIRDGINCRGERVGTSKLTAKEVIEIRRRAALGESGRSLAKEFGIKQPTASDIIRRKQWKHI